MAKLPIRSVIDRALEKREKLNNFIAVPVIFERKSLRGEGIPEYIRAGGLHAITDAVSNVGVQRVWYTEKSIELDLSNGMHISIETKPLTLAMHLELEREEVELGFVQTQLIGPGEGDSSAGLVEARIRNLRQVYAIACIAYGGSDHTENLPAGKLTEASDFESYLPASERLQISAAGQGTFWTTVGLIAGKIRAAPKAALVAISVIFKGGPERIARAAEAIVRSQEGKADETAAKARMADAVAAKAESDAAVAQTGAREAPLREAMTTERQRFELQKQKLDAYLEIREKLQNIEDPEYRATLLAGLNHNMQEALGPGGDWLQLPRSSTE